MRAELNEQAQGDKDAGDIRTQPAWVAHDLEGRGRGCTCLLDHFAGCHLILKKGQTTITKRLVHGDGGLARFILVRILHPDAAGKVLGYARASVLLMGCFEERETEGVIIADEPQSHFILLAAYRNLFSPPGKSGQKEASEGLLAVHDLNKSSRRIAFVSFADGG